MLNKEMTIHWPDTPSILVSMFGEEFLMSSKYCFLYKAFSWAGEGVYGVWGSRDSLEFEKDESFHDASGLIPFLVPDADLHALFYGNRV